MKTTQGSNETMNYGKSTHRAASLPICRIVMIRGRSFQWNAKILQTSWLCATPVQICSKNLKRSLRVLHYPSSPEKGAEIEPFASVAALLIQRCVGGF